MLKIIPGTLFSCFIAFSCSLVNSQENNCSFDEKFTEFIKNNETFLAIHNEIETRYQNQLKEQDAKQARAQHCQWVNEVEKILTRHDYEKIFFPQKDKFCELYKEIYSSYNKRLQHLSRGMTIQEEESLKTEPGKFKHYSQEMGQLFLNTDAFTLSQYEISTPLKMKVIKLDGQAYFGECGEAGLKVVVFEDKQADSKNDLLNDFRTKDLVAVIKDPYRMPNFINDQFKDNIYEYDYSENIDYLDDNVLSVTATTYVYTGGAHGNSAIEKRVFDLNHHRQLTLDDIFSQNDIPGIMKLAKKQFLKDLNLSDQKSWEELGYWFKKEDSIKVESKWLTDDGFYLTQNFNVDNEGITFLYQPYEVTCYACGVPEFKLLWKDLGAFLAKDSVANKYLSRKS